MEGVSEGGKGMDWNTGKVELLEPIRKSTQLLKLEAIAAWCGSSEDVQERQ